MMSNNTMPMVSISYAHYVENWKDGLALNLRTLEQQDKMQIVIWNDAKINTGDKLYPDIQQAMSQAVAVFVISLYFLVSDFIINEEITFLLKRLEHDGRSRKAQKAIGD